MALKAAFIFLAPDGDPDKHAAWVKTDAVELLAIGVKNYDTAAKVAIDLVKNRGIGAIELCGGFGHAGAAKVVEAVGPHVPVGVVRFDGHPGLGGKSGDSVFGK